MRFILITLKSTCLNPLILLSLLFFVYTLLFFPSLFSGTRIFPRAKKTKFDAYRYPNDPAVGHACHGIAKGAPVVTLTAGTKVTATTSYGAGHGGGQCAWFFSTDQTKWYKFAETPDCTSQSTDGQSFDFTPPATAPAACDTDAGCVLGWFWTPKLSGGCETYINCFDVRISGATGGMETSNPSVTTPLPQCIRVNPTTGLTPMFGSKMGSESGGGGGGGGSTPPAAPDNSSGGGSGTTCVTYTVKSGDTLSSIAIEFDVVGGYQKIYELNMETMKDEDTIDIGQVLKMPGGDCLKDGEVAQPTTPSGKSESVNGGSGGDDRPDTSTGMIVLIVLIVMSIVSGIAFFGGFVVGKKKGIEESSSGGGSGSGGGTKNAIAMGHKV